MAARKTLSIVLGVGAGGTGEAVGRHFAKVYDAVALLARTPAVIEKIAAEITEEGHGVAAAFTCDTSKPESLEAAFNAIREKFPSHDLKTAVFNASSPFIMRPFLDLQLEDFQRSIDIVIKGAFIFSQHILPLMLEHGSGGTLIFTGATASLRGGAKFVAVAPSKFALRALSQSLAREFGPRGIHVAHSIIDGLIDTVHVGSIMGESTDGSRISPEAIAKAYVYLAEQDKSCWTQELDIRPFVEKW